MKGGMQPDIVFYTAIPGPSPGEPQPAGAKDYRELLGPKGGWTRFLKDRSCLVLCPPWGLWAPYVYAIEPENWSPLAEGMAPDMTWLEFLQDYHGLQDLDPEGVGAFGEIDPGLIFQKELWEWAAKPTSTTVVVLPAPGQELPHRTGVGFAGHALLNHLIPGFGFRPSTERVKRDDLREVEDEHRPWVKALGSMWAGSAFELGEYSDRDFLEGLSSEDIGDNFENSRFLLARNTLPKPPMATRVRFSDPTLIAQPRGDDGLGVAVHGRVGEGHLVAVMAAIPNDAKQVGRVRSASLTLHELLHREGFPKGGSSPNDNSALASATAANPPATTRDDEGGTMTLMEITNVLSEVGFGERTWTYHAVRHRLKRDTEGFFADLKARRLPGKRGKFPRGGFRAILRPHLARIRVDW